MAAGFLIENAPELFAKLETFSTLHLRNVSTMANIPKTGQTTNPDTKTNRFPLTWIHLLSGVVLIAAIALLAWLDANNGDKYDYWIYLSLVVIAYYCYQIPRTAHKEGRVEK